MRRRGRLALSNLKLSTTLNWTILSVQCGWVLTVARDSLGPLTTHAWIPVSRGAVRSDGSFFNGPLKWSRRFKTTSLHHDPRVRTHIPFFS